MNNETYEALKRIIDKVNGYGLVSSIHLGVELGDDIHQVKTWIDEVAKEYED